MNFSVHKKLDQKRFFPVCKAEKRLLTFICILLMIPYIFVTGAALFLKEYLLGMTLFCLLLLLGVAILYATAMPLQSGYLKLTDEIVFYNKVGKYRYRKYQYQDIAWLYVGYCPIEFTKKKSRTYHFSTEEWASMYGKYIVALNSDKGTLFACGYRDDAWNLLVNKCQNTAQHIMTEEEFQTYQEMQKRLEEETCMKNSYQEKISKYDGYVN